MVNQNPKIYFSWRRGNIEKELATIQVDKVGEELKGIDLYKLRNIFENRIKKGPEIKSKLDVIYIYVLIDPRTFEVRYVGKTNDPTERMRAHISPHIYMRHNNAKCIWIEELKALGLRPVMQILTHCKIEESEIYEYRYYKLFKDSCGLLNKATISKETLQIEIKY